MAAGQIGSGDTGNEPFFLDDAQDTFACLRVDIGLMIQDARYCRL
jgi:hypothetical protein